MLPFRKVVFPVDYSDPCNAAVPYVKEIVERFDTELSLVHAYGSESLPGNEIVFADPSLAAKAQESELARLREFAGSFQPRRVETVVQLGDPGSVIDNLIRHQQTDLVMLPTHGRGLVRRMLLGSVAAKVLHDTSAAVWTATPDALRAPSKPYKSVLCAVDLSNQEEAQVVVKGAAWIASAYGAKLSLVNILELTPMAIEVDYAAFHSALREAADVQLRELKASLGVDAPHNTAEGAVSVAIREEAARTNADLVVTGRGSQQGTMGRLWSNLYQIVREAPCPVLSV